jgi:hypothetical protein
MSTAHGETAVENTTEGTFVGVSPSLKRPGPALFGEGGTDAVSGHPP